MNVFQRAASGLREVTASACGIDVLYEVDTEQVEAVAVVGSTLFEIDNGYGVVEKTEARDYLIDKKWLFLSTGEVTPAAGHRILERDGDTVYVYEAMAFGKEPAWRWSDRFRQTYRIHTKHVETRANA